MLEARIISPRGSLYIAADATPYDVQQLRTHVRALCTANAGDVQVTLRLGPISQARIGELVGALGAKLANEGVRVRIGDRTLVRNVAGDRNRAPATPTTGAPVCDLAG